MQSKVTRRWLQMQLPATLNGGEKPILRREYNTQRIHQECPQLVKTGELRRPLSSPGSTVEVTPTTQGGTTRHCTSKPNEAQPDDR